MKNFSLIVWLVFCLPSLFLVLLIVLWLCVWRGEDEAIRITTDWMARSLNDRTDNCHFEAIVVLSAVGWLTAIQVWSLLVTT